MDTDGSGVRVEQIKNGDYSWFAEDPGVYGAWAVGQTEAEARTALARVLAEGPPKEPPGLDAYVEAAMRRATFEMIENGDEPCFVTVPELQGVWAVGADQGSTLTELDSVVRDWVGVRQRLRLEIPVLAGIDLNAPLAV